MFRKIKRYFADDIVSAEKDVAVTVAGLLYDVAFVEGMDVLHYGRVFATDWWKGKKNGLDITFGAISAVAYGQSTHYSFMSVDIEEELNNKFKNSAISDLKARGCSSFSAACTFLVVNSFKEQREKNFGQTLAFFNLPRTQPVARGQSEAYTRAVNAGDDEEKARLVRSSKNGPETHLYIKPSLTVGHAETDIIKLRESKLKFEKYDYHEGFPR